MSDTLFTDNFPFIETDEVLEAEKTRNPHYDTYYVASGCIEERKDRFDRLWSNFKPYADRHFLSEVKKSFHQRTWEMYMGNVLLKKELVFKSANQGPDFIINNNAYIECVAPTKGDSAKEDSVPNVEHTEDVEDMCLQEVPTDKMILRITQAIKDKSEDQYRKWKDKPWFDESAPFVIAINSGYLEHTQSYLGIPIIIKALFGLEYLQIDQNGNESFSWREEIKKGAGVPVNIFTNDQMKSVSGVIFTDNMVLNHPEIVGDDCIFVNNPFAANPAPKELTEKFKNWYTIRTEKGINIRKGYDRQDA